MNLKKVTASQVKFLAKTLKWLLHLPPSEWSHWSTHLLLLDSHVYTYILCIVIISQRKRSKWHVGVSIKLEDYSRLLIMAHGSLLIVSTGTVDSCCVPSPPRISKQQSTAINRMFWFPLWWFCSVTKGHWDSTKFGPIKRVLNTLTSCVWSSNPIIGSEFLKRRKL